MGFNCGMLFRVIHVQSLIRDILHVEWKSGKERARACEKERESEREKDGNYRIHI